jgi:hypothetical protein
MPDKNHKYDNPLDMDSITQFLSVMQDSTETGKPVTKTENVKHKSIPIQDRPKTDRNGRELKRKRYNLLLVPSLYEDIEKIAYVQNISANEAINRALAFYLEKEKETLDKYAEIEKLKMSEKTD